jgi:drug/metabolite transporter (DMT)-like permease
MRDEVQLASDIYRLEGATSTPVLVAAPPATKMVVILTRKLQTSDSSATMAYCSSLVYLAASLVLLPLPAMVGEMPNVHPGIAFVIRPWSKPPFRDWLIMSALGLIWTAWLYLLSRAYSLAEASVAAPFEYVSLPINMTWGFLNLARDPDLVNLSWCLIGSGEWIVCSVPGACGTAERGRTEQRSGKWLLSASRHLRSNLP